MTEQTQGQDGKPAGMPPLLKLVLEIGPLVLFFVAFQYFKGDGDIAGTTQALLAATGVLMVALVISNGVTYWLTRALSKMTVMVTIIALVMGGLTLAIGDVTFIKMRPTLVSGMFAAVLGFGLWRGRSYLKLVMEELLPMQDEGWMKLTRNFALFFLGMAILNEFVWRTQSDETWVWVKTFVYAPLNVAFTLSQIPIMSRYELKEGAGAEAESADGSERS